MGAGLAYDGAVPNRRPNVPWLLIGGDALTIAIVTAAGFATHGLLETASNERLLATFLPFLFAWCVAAAAVGGFDPTRAEAPRQLWRPAIAALLAAPLGAVLRGAWLGAPVLPLFAGIMAATMTVAMLLWRGGYLLVRSRRTR